MWQVEVRVPRSEGGADLDLGQSPLQGFLDIFCLQECGIDRCELVSQRRVVFVGWPCETCPTHLGKDKHLGVSWATQMPAAPPRAELISVVLVLEKP